MEVIIGVIVGIAIGVAIAWVALEARNRGRIAEQDAGHRETIAGLQGQLAEAKTGEKLLESAKEQLSEAFQATASRVAANNSAQFLELADQNLAKTMAAAKGELEQRHQQFQELVKPLSENYNKLDPTIKSLMEQNVLLAEKATDLTSALKDNRRVGSWGEVQLRRVVELADMTAYCDFAEQPTLVGTGDRPDLIVRLPDQRTVIIDAKTSTSAFLDAQEADTSEGVEEALGRHAKALKTQVDSLSRKKYGTEDENSLDFVVMFVPGDQFLAAALRSDPDLVRYAMEKKVAIATPASLIALLWAVAKGWQQHKLAENAAQVAKAADEFVKGLNTFAENYARVGRGLEAAVRAYNTSVGSYSNSVERKGKPFAELAGKGADALPTLVEVQTPLRQPDIALPAGVNVEEDVA